MIFAARLPGAVAPDSATLPAMCADRAAIERVYHEHRTGTKPDFAQAMPADLIEKLVRQDAHKEAVLLKTYSFEVTPAVLAAEVLRIDTTTRAPEVLAELKQALGNDPARFARSVARPIVVERELRRCFENDASLHGAQRRVAEQIREDLRAGKAVEGLRDVTWQLTPRPEGTGSEPAGPPPQTKGTAKGGVYSVEATAQVAQALTPPPEARDEKQYFDELNPELQNVLRAQLQKPDDVSAVIETSGGFLVFQAKERTAATLSVRSFSLPKRSYEEWLASQ